jgi:hypothetical protein
MQSNMSSFDVKERLEYLKDKIDHIDVTLSDLIELGKTLKISFDYSLVSLDYLELILIRIDPDFNQPEHSGLFEDSWIYIGETYRRVLKGKWGIANDEERYTEKFYGLPMVSEFDAYSSELFPMIILDAFMDKKELSFLRHQADQFIDPDSNNGHR